jgi:hypothetical protein
MGYGPPPQPLIGSLQAVTAIVPNSPHYHQRAFLGHTCLLKQARLYLSQDRTLARFRLASSAPLRKFYSVGKVPGTSCAGCIPCVTPHVSCITHHVSRLTCFSFYATKNLTTAEGGMLTGNPDVVEKARVISLHGMSRDAWKRYSAEGSWYYEVVCPGFKYNMTDIQAAIGLHQLAKLPRFHARRREIAHRYNEAFSQFEELQIPTERPEVEHAWHLYVLRLNVERLNVSRNQFIEELKARNIGTSVHFIPIHLHPYYRDKYGYKPEDFPVAYREYQRLISLPLYPRMSDQDVQDVIGAVLDVVEKYKR